MEKVFLLLLFFAGINLLQAQEDTQHSQTFTHKMISEEHIEYIIKVTPPPNYDDSKVYPTLYYLDAWWLEDIVKGTYTLLNYSGAVKEVLLVGISIDGDELKFNERRTLDYTPAPYDLDSMKFTFSIPLKPTPLLVTSDNSGAASTFRKFLSNKVFPEISKHYAVNQNDRALLGHSFGGLFGIYDMAERDHLFNSYIIISPSLWWNRSAKLYEKIAQTFKTRDTPINLFFCYGESENNGIVKWSNVLNDYLKSKEFSILSYEFVSYDKRDHTSVLPESIYDGIKYLYEK